MHESFADLFKVLTWIIHALFTYRDASVLVLSTGTVPLSPAAS